MAKWINTMIPTCHTKQAQFVKQLVGIHYNKFISLQKVLVNLWGM